jgi:enoyl-CoA hydratase/carnithine racemase
VRVLRILSEGKYFCSGYDISSLASDSAPSSLYFGQTMDLVEAARPVTIAAVQGGAYGGGTDLCLACDFRIGTPQADMFMPATRLGLHFYAGGMSRYVTRLGLDQAKRLFLTAERLQADEMLRIGFLTELVPADRLQDRLDALSAQIAGMAPIPLFGVKAQLNRIARGEVDGAAIEAAVLRSEQSRDLAEGAQAWKEQRAPNFTGG